MASGRGDWPWPSLVFLLGPAAIDHPLLSEHVLTVMTHQLFNSFRLAAGLKRIAGGPIVPFGLHHE